MNTRVPEWRHRPKLLLDRLADGQGMDKVREGLFVYLACSASELFESLIWVGVFLATQDGLNCLRNHNPVRL